MQILEKIFRFGGVLLMLVMSCYHGQHLWQQPNGYLGVEGDGFKNYATVEYHVKHDKALHHFEGMNYPHGDHIAFADAQPIIANAIKLFSTHIYDVSDNTRAILHSLLFLSLWLTFLFIYLIFNQLQIEKSIASIAAAAITWLSPQLARWEEHYALGYTFVIPCLLYLLLRFEQKNTFLKSLFIGVFAIVLAQIHLYYLAIVLLFLAAYHFFSFAKKIDEKIRQVENNRIDYLIITSQQAFHFLIQAFLPAIFISQYWLKIGTQITDRPNVPGGFLIYRTYFEGFLFHPKSFLGKFFQANVSFTSPMENATYLGVGVFIGITFFFFSFFAKKIKTYNFHPLFLAAIPLLALSLGLPFIFSDWEKYLAYTGVLQQFRGVGRFSWVFFYIINVVVFIYFLKEKKQLTLIFLSVVWLDVCFFCQKPLTVLPENYFLQQINKGNKDWLEAIDVAKYQAIVPFPFFHIGSEQFDIAPSDNTLPFTFLVSLEKGLPTVGVQMSRISFEQAYLSQRFGISYTDKKPLFAEKIIDKKPFLLIQNKKNFDTTLTDRWNGFLITKIVENKDIALYELNIQDFQANKRIDASEVAASSKIFFQGKLREENIIFKQKIENQQAKQAHSLHFDWLCAAQSQPLLEYEIRELHPSTGALLHYYHYGCRYHRTAMSDDNWVSCSIPFDTWFGDSIVEVRLFYKNADKKVDLLVRNCLIDSKK